VQHDDAFAADMQLVRDMLFSHDRIKRTVTNLPNGIKTVTESDDPKTAQTIKTHVASMVQRLSDGKEFNLFSKTIPVLFENKDKIKTTVETTEKGSIVTQTSTDPKVVTALQKHATEVDELVREGMVAMMRNMRANMAMMPRGPGADFGPSVAPPTAAPAR
jgi:phage tail sheath protein FI